MIRFNEFEEVPVEVIARLERILAPIWQDDWRFHRGGGLRVHCIDESMRGKEGPLPGWAHWDVYLDVCPYDFDVVLIQQRVGGIMGHTVGAARRVFLRVSDDENLVLEAMRERIDNKRVKLTEFDGVGLTSEGIRVLYDAYKQNKEVRP